MILTIVEAALRSMLLALAVWAALRVFRVRNVLAQKACWGLVLAASLLMPLLVRWSMQVLPDAAFVVPVPHVVLQPADTPAASVASVPVVTGLRKSLTLPEEPAPATLPIDSQPVRATLPADSSFAPSPVPASYPAVRVEAPAAKIAPKLPITTGSLAVLLYVAIACACTLRVLIGLGSALLLWLRAQPVPLAAEFAAGLALRSSRSVASPVTIGSAVLLPAEFTDWDPEKLRIVLAHERSHIRQGDFYLQLLAALYAAMFWFSPLGWWLKRELSDLAETISDRAGLEQAQSCSSYAQILLEFAAAPRPTPIGVAMARSASLSRRIERLLDDITFRQAFAGGRRRALIAVLLVPCALIAATCLVRVQAAQQATNPQPAPAAQPASPAQSSPAAEPAPSEEPRSGQANPAPAATSDREETAPRSSGFVIAVPPFAPVIPAAPMAPVAPVAPPVPPAGVTLTVPMAAVPWSRDGIAFAPVEIAPAPRIQITTDRATRAYTRAYVDSSARWAINSQLRGAFANVYAYRGPFDGDSYVVVRGDHRNTMNFSGDFHSSEIEKAQKLAHGDFLWFNHDGKAYFVDDPAIVQQIDAMYKPMEELGKKQEALGKQQEALGKQQEDLGKLQEQASVPTPDMSDEIAKLNAALAKLQSKTGKSLTQDELGDLQEKIGEIQAKLGDLQGMVGAKQGELGEQQGRLGEKQGQLGDEQGRLGAEQGRLAMEADGKIRKMIEDSLQSGKAHPVE
jgi:beta-lactamase regulating signal transducer with metallopeptidase domain